MKSLQLAFIFFCLLSLGTSCKSDSKIESEEIKVNEPKVAISKSTNPIASVDRVYRSNEVDVAALFSASCKNEKNQSQCSKTMFREYITENLVNPNQGQEIKQREVITFTIMPDGSIGKNVRSITKKEVCTGCKAEAIKVVSNMPKWIPAMKEGKAVAVSMTVPVTF